MLLLPFSCYDNFSLEFRLSKLVFKRRSRLRWFEDENILNILVTLQGFNGLDQAFMVLTLFCGVLVT
jgi:hypothetical protein